MVSTAPRQAIKRDFVPYLREKGFALDMTLRFLPHLAILHGLQRFTCC